MILRKSLNNPTILIRIGAAALLLASLSRWFIHPTVDLWRGFIDGITGVLYGIAIAGMLLGARLKTRAGNNRACAQP